MAFNTIPIKRLDDYVNVCPSEFLKDSDFLYLAMTHSFQDISSPTKYWTLGHSSERVKS